jgi:hypothetical protein
MTVTGVLACGAEIFDCFWAGQWEIPGKTLEFMTNITKCAHGSKYGVTKVDR